MGLLFSMLGGAVGVEQALESRMNATSHRLLLIIMPPKMPPKREHVVKAFLCGLQGT